jgi:hypothetical protein
MRARCVTDIAHCFAVVRARPDAVFVQVAVSVAQDSGAAARQLEELVVQLRIRIPLLRAEGDIRPVAEEVDEGYVGGVHVGTGGAQLRVRRVVVVRHADPALERRGLSGMATDIGIEHWVEN